MEWQPAGLYPVGASGRRDEFSREGCREKVPQEQLAEQFDRLDRRRAPTGISILEGSVWGRCGEDARGKGF